MTNSEKENVKALSEQNSAGSCVRESESIDHLTAYFLSQILTLVCMTHEVTLASQDACTREIYSTFHELGLLLERRRRIIIMAFGARLRLGRTGYVQTETFNDRLSKPGVRIQKDKKFLHYSFFNELQWGQRFL
jgi:hypothetical protein